MGKLPAFQFYPGDWLKDPSLRRCSTAARGLWMDMICLLHEMEERGVFATLGQPWSDNEIAAALPGNPSENLALLTELCQKGVAKRREDRAIFCARMVRDEHIRTVRSDAGRAGGQAKCKQNPSKQASKTEAKRKQIPEDESEDGDVGEIELENEVVSAWNSAQGVRVSMLPVSEKRRKSLRARLSEPAWRETWRSAIEKFPLKCFIGNDDWKPDFEWFVRPDTVRAILEGKYDWSKTNGKPTNQPGSGQRYQGD